MESNRMSSKRIAFMGMFVAVALVLSYLESLIPLDFAVPGVKLGIANIVTIIVLIRFGFPEALTVSLIRIIISALLFSNMLVAVYSICGSVLSIVVMMILKKVKIFGTLGISASGGVFHNMGQIALAAFLMENQSIFYYIPILIISGVITGILVGMAAGIINKKIKMLSL